MLPLLLISLLAAEPSLSPVRPREPTPQDLAAIKQVMTDFQAAIRKHDGKLLFSLMHDWNVLFTAPPTKETIDRTRAIDPNYAGLRPGGLQRFIDFIANSKDQLEERFLNPVIVQDADLAIVTFDYQFVENDKVSNDGIEVWQLTRRDGVWKIVSVMWTHHDVPARAVKDEASPPGEKVDGNAGAICRWGTRRGELMKQQGSQPKPCQKGLTCCATGGAGGSDSICMAVQNVCPAYP